MSLRYLWFINFSVPYPVFRFVYAKDQSPKWHRPEVAKRQFRSCMWLAGTVGVAHWKLAKGPPTSPRTASSDTGCQARGCSPATYPGGTLPAGKLSSIHGHSNLPLPNSTQGCSAPHPLYGFWNCVEDQMRVSNSDHPWQTMDSSWFLRRDFKREA